MYVDVMGRGVPRVGNQSLGPRSARQAPLSDAVNRQQGRSRNALLLRVKSQTVLLRDL
jgi:hypothetical protein